MITLDSISAVFYTDSERKLKRFTLSYAIDQATLVLVDKYKTPKANTKSVQDRDLTEVCLTMPELNEAIRILVNDSLATR